MALELESTCYVLLQTNAIHPIAYQKDKLLWYPERGMTLIKQIMYKPFVQSIVTENPWLISCYGVENVRVWRDDRGGEWCEPDMQTYGADIAGITHSVLGISQSIPSTPLDGGKSMQKILDETEAAYFRAQDRHRGVGVES